MRKLLSELCTCLLTELRHICVTFDRYAVSVAGDDLILGLCGEVFNHGLFLDMCLSRDRFLFRLQ